MRTRNLAAVAACLGVSLIASGPTEASQLGLYVGGFYGDASKDIEQQPFDDLAAFVAQQFEFTATDSAVSFKDDDSSYGFVVGYRWTPYLAVEGGYMDLGKVRYRSSANGAYADGQGGTEPGYLGQSFTSSTGGIAVSALGILPLSYRWEVYARGGIVFTSNDLDIFLTDGIGRAVDRHSKSSTDLLGGVGLSFSFAEIYQARFEYQRVFDAGHDETGEADVDVISIGITVTF
jgi:OOP family OmpA-OmpF porin